MTQQTVVVLGASAKPERFAYKALHLLQQHGHRVIPVHPKLKEIEGVPVVSSLANIDVIVDTLTLYIGPQHVAPLIDTLIALHPKRVILNPGTESAVLMSALSTAGIPYLRACTLVLLNCGEF